MTPARSPPFFTLKPEISYVVVLLVLNMQWYTVFYQIYCCSVNYEGNTLSNGIKYAAGKMVNILLNKSPIFDTQSRRVARAPLPFLHFPF